MSTVTVPRVRTCTPKATRKARSTAKPAGKKPAKSPSNPAPARAIVFTAQTIDPMSRATTWSGPQVDALRPACDAVEEAAGGLLDLSPWVDNASGQVFIQLGFEAAPDVAVNTTDPEAILQAIVGTIRRAADAIEFNYRAGKASPAVVSPAARSTSDGINATAPGRGRYLVLVGQGHCPGAPESHDGNMNSFRPKSVTDHPTDLQDLTILSRHDTEAEAVAVAQRINGAMIDVKDFFSDEAIVWAFVTVDLAA